ncbi:hypothetical protein CANTEDRAFT_128002 [Yamadazyma tenuis ATCC 10573]|nr:uncharacterized protein CANTEDRAFT_128002 [Yamadazyma tenuis ATCC 10573]EGV60603.1 hypothetical protein CANTEDRAFT_128002 [Yamadazyma tenuis ATCC 10573]
MSVYSHILSLPTTTPFSGTIPPSGLVGRVANETMNNLVSSISVNSGASYDQHSIINKDMLSNNSYRPIFLSLIRKRLIELCSHKNSSSKLPLSTSISINSMQNSNATGNNPYYSGNANIYASNARQSSISNLSLTELNINHYQEQQQAAAQQGKSRSSSINLRKQSLTRNNSYNSTTTSNWLHVGNLSTIRHPNESTDSLQSMQDYVPQPFINRSANGTSNSPNGNSALGNMSTPTGSAFSFNNMMMDYQTPPGSNTGSNKSSFSTPPGAPLHNIQIVQNPVSTSTTAPVPNLQEYDEFNFGSRSRSSSNPRLNGFPRPLTINTDNANLQALNSLNGNTETLDSPFMSATTPSDDFSLMQNAFINGSIPQSPIAEEREERILPTKLSLSEKKRDSLRLKRGIL